MNIKRIKINDSNYFKRFYSNQCTKKSVFKHVEITETNQPQLVSEIALIKQGNII